MSETDIEYLSKIISGHKKCMVVGKIDTGKSTLIKKISEKLDVSIIDSDIGQSDIGPPTVVSLGEKNNGTYKMIDGYFCGSATPAGHLLQMLSGLEQMSNKVKKYPVIINTTGLATGSLGRALKTEKINALMPDLIIAIERDDELKYLDTFKKTGIEVIHLPVSKHARQKTRAERSLLRQKLFKEHFIDARMTAHSLDDIALERTLINNGKIVDLSVASLSEERNYVYIETGDEEAIMITEHVGRDIGRSVKKIDVRSADVYRLNDFIGLLIGLIGPSGEFRGLGLIKSLDIQKRMLYIYSKVDDFSAAQFGSIKLSFTDFAYKGKFKPYYVFA